MSEPRHDSEKIHYRPGRLIFSGEWLNYRDNVRNIDRALAMIPAGKLLDVGCGARPFECRPGEIEWIGLDIEGNEQADFHGTAVDMPFAGETFDAILATQVLEHIEEPQRAMHEFARVLKVGGILILSCPQYWELHEEPRDFFRYTEYGLRYLCEKSGFEVFDLRREATGFGLVGLAVNNVIRAVGGTPTSTISKAIKAPFYLWVNLTSLVLGSIFRNERDVQGYTLLARKVKNA